MAQFNFVQGQFKIFTPFPLYTYKNQNNILQIKLQTIEYQTSCVFFNQLLLFVLFFLVLSIHFSIPPFVSFIFLIFFFCLLLVVQFFFVSLLLLLFLFSFSSGTLLNYIYEYQAFCVFCYIFKQLTYLVTYSVTSSTVGVDVFIIALNFFQSITIRLACIHVIPFIHQCLLYLFVPCVYWSSSCFFFQQSHFLHSFYQSSIPQFIKCPCHPSCCFFFKFLRSFILSILFRFLFFLRFYKPVNFHFRTLLLPFLCLFLHSLTRFFKFIFSLCCLSAIAHTTIFFSQFLLQCQRTGVHNQHK